MCSRESRCQTMNGFHTLAERIVPGIQRSMCMTIYSNTLVLVRIKRSCAREFNFSDGNYIAARVGGGGVVSVSV